MRNLFTITNMLILSLTLGLAPFVPEPHIWGKLKWIAGGGEGMQFMDWADTAFHGFPWIILIFLTLKKLKLYFNL